LTVGPGDISAYGTGISTPTQSNAMSSSVEVSMAAVRRGMPRQYGTRPGVGARTGGATPRLYTTTPRLHHVGAGVGVRPRHGLAEPLVARERIGVVLRATVTARPASPQGGGNRT